MQTIVNLLKRKWAEYILEILVIILGILGAFALNSWNENRKQRALEYEILTSIRDALGTDTATINTLIQSCERRIWLTQALLDAVENGISLHDSAAQFYPVLSAGIAFIPLETPYKFLESKGIDIIRNKDLMFAIVNMYDREYKLIERRTTNYMNNLRDFRRPLIRRHFKMSSTRGATYVPFDHVQMLMDNEFLNEVALMQRNCRNILEATQQVKNKVIDLIQQIDEAIGT